MDVTTLSLTQNISSASNQDSEILELIIMMTEKSSRNHWLIFATSYEKTGRHVDDTLERASVSSVVNTKVPVATRPQKYVLN